jgi:hypothetical protein
MSLFEPHLLYIHLAFVFVPFLVILFLSYYVLNMSNCTLQVVLLRLVFLSVFIGLSVSSSQSSINISFTV